MEQRYTYAMPFQRDMKHLDGRPTRQDCIDQFLALLAEQVSQDAADAA